MRQFFIYAIYSASQNGKIRIRKKADEIIASPNAANNKEINQAIDNLISIYSGAAQLYHNIEMALAEEDKVRIAKLRQIRDSKN